MAVEDERKETGPEPANGNELGWRFVSGAVLALAAIVAAYFGGWLFLLFWSAAALWVWWEWTGVVAAAPRQLLVAIGGAGMAGMAVALAADALAIALIVIVIATGVVVATAQSARAWATLGMLYAAAVVLPPVMLRGDPEHGLAAIVFLFAAVWTADIAAYFSGRLIGGPRLALRISPNKTWAGAAGGLAAGLFAALSALYAAGIRPGFAHVVVAVLIIIAAQVGDLVESAVKRRFGVKNASELIPGHGGLMDRVDGFMAAALVAVAIGIAHGGASTPASGLLVW